uniref:Uncharacterized protein n=1 Tax=Oryza brachyantha TaxID=4533 RepID=J3M7Y8_ORYBR
MRLLMVLAILSFTCPLFGGSLILSFAMLTPLLNRYSIQRPPTLVAFLIAK